MNIAADVDFTMMVVCAESTGGCVYQLGRAPKLLLLESKTLSKL